MVKLISLECDRVVFWKMCEHIYSIEHEELNLFCDYKLFNWDK